MGACSLGVVDVAGLGGATGVGGSAAARRPALVDDKGLGSGGGALGVGGGSLGSGGGFGFGVRRDWNTGSDSGGGDFGRIGGADLGTGGGGGSSSGGKGTQCKDKMTNACVNMLSKYTLCKIGRPKFNSEYVQ